MVGPNNNTERQNSNLWSSGAPSMSAAFNIEAAKDRPHPEAEAKARKAKKQRGPSMGGSRFHSGGRKARHPQASTPFSIRLAPAERKRLEEDAAGEPLGAYVKKTLFSPTTKAAARRAMIDHHRVLIAQVLAMVGSSGIGDALTSMAVAIKMGTLANEAEVLEALNEAQDELADKGLECENAVLIPCEARRFGNTDYSRCRLYVALSRAKRSLTLVLCSNNPGPLFQT